MCPKRRRRAHVWGSGEFLADWSGRGGGKSSKKKGEGNERYLFMVRAGCRKRWAGALFDPKKGRGKRRTPMTSRVRYATGEKIQKKKEEDVKERDKKEDHRLLLRNRERGKKKKERKKKTCPRASPPSKQHKGRERAKKNRQTHQPLARKSATTPKPQTGKRKKKSFPSSSDK